MLNKTNVIAQGALGTFIVSAVGWAVLRVAWLCWGYNPHDSIIVLISQFSHHQLVPLSHF